MASDPEVLEPPNYASSPPSSGNPTEQRPEIVDGARNNKWLLLRIQAWTGIDITPTATLELRDPNGNLIRDAAIGETIILATWEAIRRIVDDKMTWKSCSVESLGDTPDAEVEVAVTVANAKGQTAEGVARHADTIHGAALAFINAINELLTLDH